VLPTFADRHAITIWYYDQTERAEAVKRAREEGTASKVATATVQSQQMAKVSDVRAFAVANCTLHWVSGYKFHVQRTTRRFRVFSLNSSAF
jgi:hypothetical protein